jgi:hypothetical protein
LDPQLDQLHHALLHPRRGARRHPLACARARRLVHPSQGHARLPLGRYRETLEDEVRALARNLRGDGADVTVWDEDALHDAAVFAPVFGTEESYEGFKDGVKATLQALMGSAVVVRSISCTPDAETKV